MSEATVEAAVADTRKFIWPPGHEKCHISSHIFDCLTFGTGRLESNGCWEFGCEVCARAHEEQFPDAGPCWPHTDADLVAMGLLKEGERR